MNLPATGIAALDAACRFFGSQDRLAEALNLKSPSITGWRSRNRVPAERCREIEEATEGLVTRYQLRPDVFGDAPAVLPVATDTSLGCSVHAGTLAGEGGDVTIQVKNS